MLFGWFKAVSLVSLILVAWVGVGLLYRRGIRPGEDEPAECPGCGCASLARAPTDRDGRSPWHRQRTDCPGAAAADCHDPTATDNLTYLSPIPTATESE